MSSSESILNTDWRKTWRERWAQSLAAILEQRSGLTCLHAAPLASRLTTAGFLRAPLPIRSGSTWRVYEFEETTEPTRYLELRED